MFNFLKRKSPKDFFLGGGTTVISGKTGAGKTLCAVRIAKECAESGVPVFTNIEVNIKGVNLLTKGSVFALAHSAHARHFVVILDEMASVDMSREELAFLATHLVQARKRFGGHWVFIAQDYRFFPIEIRRLALHVFECVNTFGLKKVRVFEQVSYESFYAVGGSDGDKRSVKRTTIKRYLNGSRYYSLYDSFAFVSVECFDGKNAARRNLTRGECLAYRWWREQTI